MSDLIEKCAVCGALVDEEDLFCANCGTEAERSQPATSLTDRPATADGVARSHHFECAGCGASMSFDAAVGTLRCPFCGAQRLERRPPGKVLSARRILPFEVSRDAAVQTMRKWLGRGFWRPGDLARAATVTEMSAVYVPFWVFSARTHTYWTADTSRTPVGARGDWYPLSGEHRGSYEDLLIGASGALTMHETSAICPFDLTRGRPASEVDSRQAAIEQFRVKRKYARPLARQGLEDAERQACAAQYVPDRCRNMKVNVRIEDLSSEPVLLPVWIMAYRYRDELYRFLVNGQTAKATGQAPTSWAKIALVVAIAIVGIMVMLCVVGLFAT